MDLRGGGGRKGNAWGCSAKSSVETLYEISGLNTLNVKSNLQMGSGFASLVVCGMYNLLHSYGCSVLFQNLITYRIFDFYSTSRKFVVF